MRSSARFMGNVVKWIVRLIGILALLMLIAGVASFFIRPGEIPDVDKAPWSIQTYSNDEMRVPSRIYYAQELIMDDNTPVIVNYWTYDGEKYHYHKGELPFPFDDYGNIDIKRRQGQ